MKIRRGGTERRLFTTRLLAVAAYADAIDFSGGAQRGGGRRPLAASRHVDSERAATARRSAKN
ncbi:hypothetical protein [Novipirellula rosea]|uniref:hypothetical protein n=1 Tax=Novipirellula rosea TaxID=1031540 RepID=UPI0031EE2C3E